MLPVLGDWGRALYRAIFTCKLRSTNSGGQLLTESWQTSPFQTEHGFCLHPSTVQAELTKRSAPRSLSDMELK